MQFRHIALLLIAAVLITSGCLNARGGSDPKSNKVTVIEQLKLGENRLFAGATTFAEMRFVNHGTKNASAVNAELSDPCLLKIESVMCNHPEATKTEKGCYWNNLQRLDGTTISWQLTAPDFAPSATLNSCQDILFKVNFTYSSKYSLELKGAPVGQTQPGDQIDAPLTQQSDYAPVIPKIKIGAKQPITVGSPFSILITLENVETGNVVNNIIKKESFIMKFDSSKIRVVKDGCPDFQNTTTTESDPWILARDVELRDGRASLPLRCRLNFTSITPGVPEDAYYINFDLNNLGYEYTRKEPMTIVPKPE